MQEGRAKNIRTTEMRTNRTITRLARTFRAASAPSPKPANFLARHRRASSSLSPSKADLMQRFPIRATSKTHARILPSRVS